MQNKHLPRKLATVDCKSKGKTQEHNATTTRDKLQKCSRQGKYFPQAKHFEMAAKASYGVLM